MAPPPTLTLSEWADAKRVLSAETSAEPGQWRTSRAEYLRGIMDAISDPTVHTVIVKKAAQVGLTEVLGNTLGYYIDQDPTSILLMQPTETLAESWSKERLEPMLRDTPALRGRVGEAKSRTTNNTVQAKSFPGGYLAIVGANTPSKLASRPIRVVLGDEVDRWPASAGREGDPLQIVSKRQTTYWNRKRVLCSTPVEKGASVIEREFEVGDQRQFYVPCPDCGEHQVLGWEQVVWDTDDEGMGHPETAHYQCEECGSLWNDVQRWAAVSKGQWNAGVPFDGVASFALTGFMSPWLTLEQIVTEYLAAEGKPLLMKVWTNTVCGEGWAEKGRAADADTLSNRVEPYDMDELPEAVRLVTAGVDTQDDRLEVTFTGWGTDEECWIIMHGLLMGDPGQKEVWNDLDKTLKETRFTTEDGRKLRCRAACVDSQGHHSEMVLAFARKRAHRRLYATKGLANTPSSPKPIWTGALLRSKNSGDRLWGVGVDTGKDDLLNRLKIVPRELRTPAEEGATPRAIHFPIEGLPATYFDQLTSEHAVTEVTKEGRAVRRWKLKPGKSRNEALDCFILAQAAMLSLPSRLMTYGGRRQAKADAAEAKEEPAPAKAKKPARVAKKKAEPAEAKPERKRAERKRWRAYA